MPRTWNFSQWDMQWCLTGEKKKKTETWWSRYAFLWSFRRGEHILQISMLNAILVLLLSWGGTEGSWQTKHKGQPQTWGLAHKDRRWTSLNLPSFSNTKTSAHLTKTRNLEFNLFHTGHDEIMIQLLLLHDPSAPNLCPECVWWWNDQIKRRIKKEGHYFGLSAH